MAGLFGIDLRTGCFCNSGACQLYLGHSDDQLLHYYEVFRFQKPCRCFYVLVASSPLYYQYPWDETDQIPTNHPVTFSKLWRQKCRTVYLQNTLLLMSHAFIIPGHSFVFQSNWNAAPAPLSSDLILSVTRTSRHARPPPRTLNIRRTSLALKLHFTSWCLHGELICSKQ